jgi:hypothetical protein
MRKRSQKTSEHVILAPVASRKPERSREPLPAWDRRTWLVAIPVAIVAFIPALDNGFAEWDDSENFLDNRYYRGPGAA